MIELSFAEVVLRNGVLTLCTESQTELFLFGGYTSRLKNIAGNVTLELSLSACWLGANTFWIWFILPSLLLLNQRKKRSSSSSTKLKEIQVILQTPLSFLWQDALFSSQDGFKASVVWQMALETSRCNSAFLKILLWDDCLRVQARQDVLVEDLAACDSFIFEFCGLPWDGKPKAFICDHFRHDR